MEKLGIIILDKPAGMTSFQACDAVRKKLGADKAGHAGTLDPAVTGILIIAINQATKIFPLLSGLDKKYRGTAHLHKKVEEEKIKQEIKKFIGKIRQLPPRRSRVKRQERTREIYEFKFLKKQDKEFTFIVHCEAGTYIRKLIHDLGEKIGGAHMASLRRIEQGPFLEKESIKLDKIKDKDLVPMEKVIKRIKAPILKVSDQEAKSILNGVRIKTKVTKKYDTAVIFNNNKIIALAKIEDNIIKPKRVI
jgi:H/ACA ribonucleoprotein complex subunit 4